MLGSEVLSVRLGGIYDLERLAAEHPEQYHLHLQVMELFCAFARNPTDDKRITSSPQPLDDPDEEVQTLRADVQDVMRAIGTRGRWAYLSSRIQKTNTYYTCVTPT